MTSKQIIIAKRQLTGLLASLTIVFILGVILTTVISYDPNKHSSVQTGFLIAHAVIAVSILIGGMVRFILSIMWHSLRMLSLLALLSSVAAFVSGDIAARTGNSTAVLIMAIGFILSFILYGYNLWYIKQK